MTTKLTPLRCFVILAVITVGLALGLPPDPHAVHQLHTSATAYRVAIAALLIPYLVIWYLSFYAFAKLQEYGGLLKKTKDGAAFHKITIGMGGLAFSLIVPTTVSLVLNTIAARNHGFEATAVITNNYLSLFPALVSFLLLYDGTRALLRTAKGGLEKLDLRLHIPWFLLFSILFSRLTLENQYRWHPYHLTSWLLVVTFIVPYLYTWTIGLMSTYDLRLYARTVHGSLYRQAIKQFAWGITVLIAASVAIQFINITLGQRIGKSLGSLLPFDYALLIIAAIGLGLMASGTKKLKRIEEA